jgi:hypothetical protein
MRGEEVTPAPRSRGRKEAYFEAKQFYLAVPILMIPSTMIKRMMKELISTSSEAVGFIIGPFHNILGNRDSPLLLFFSDPPVSANPGKLPGNSLHFDQTVFRSRGVHSLGGRLSL